MIGRKRLIRVIAVLSVAIATGQTVESLRLSEARADRSVASAQAGDRLPGSASLHPAWPEALPEIRGITPVAAVRNPSEPDACAPQFSLAAAEGAMIDLTLVAPCNAGQRIVVRHSGLSFTALTGPDGRLSQTLPALEAEALVTAYFEGSGVALATIDVPEVVSLDRFVLQAPYPVDFKLRAVAGGTVLSGSSETAAASADSIATLGTEAVAEPLVAQVYTFAADDAVPTELLAEIRITDLTCSRSFLLESRLSRGGIVSARTIPVSVPLCGTSGDILVLKNLVPAPTLAAPR